MLYAFIKFPKAYIEDVQWLTQNNIVITHSIKA